MTGFRLKIFHVRQVWHAGKRVRKKRRPFFYSVQTIFNNSMNSSFQTAKNQQATSFALFIVIIYSFHYLSTKWNCRISSDG